MKKLYVGLGLLLVTFALVLNAQSPPPIIRNPWDTNSGAFILHGSTLIISNNTAGANGWFQFDGTSLGIFDKNGQSMGKIYTANGSGIAMDYGGNFSGLFTNGTMVIHTRSGSQIPLSVQGDFTSQTTFLIAAWTNSGTAQYVFTVDAGGKIYSRNLLSSLALYSDSSSNIVSASTAAITYQANTSIVNFASSPYQTLTMTNDTVFTNSNQQANRAIAVKLTAGTTNQALSFPSGWTFIGSPAPTTITSNKTAVLSLTAFGSNPTDIVAVYCVQP